MIEKKFDPKNLYKLNNPQRYKDIPPEYIWEKLQMKESGVFVEIGAGTAFFSVAFFEKYKPEKLYACDLSRKMVDWINENISSKHSGIIPIKTEEATIPLENEIADLVFMINLHHELEKPLLTLEEAFRILKVEGEIFIVDWKKQEMAEGPPVEIRCDPEKVRSQMEDAGFSAINIYHGLPKHFLLIGKKKPLSVKYNKNNNS